MSNTTVLAFALAAALFVVPASHAQICNHDVTLSSQAAVNAFDCSEVTGFLRISGSDITDLSPLVGLGFVGGELFIGDNPGLPSLQGLSGLSTVGGDLFVQTNAALPSLQGLEGLTDVGGELFVGLNPALTSLSGLGALQSVGDFFKVIDNDALPSLEGPGVLSVIGHALFIRDNDALVSVAGLESLTTIGGGLDIADNASLASLEGLEGLTDIGGAAVMVTDLVINDNDALVSLRGLENVSDVGGRLLIRLNDALSACAPGLTALISCDPPAFVGVAGGASISSNASGGQCYSAQAVLDDACSSVANDSPSDSPRPFALAVPYPNPSRRAVTVTFDVAVPTNVRLVVFDGVGREVAVLVDGARSAGRHEASLDARGLPSGVYYVRLTAGASTATQAVTLLAK